MKVLIIAFALLFTGYLLAVEDTSKIIEDMSKQKGINNLQDVKDFKISGQSFADKTHFNFNYYFMKPNYHRIDITSPGLSIISVLQGDVGYVKQSFYPTVPIDDKTRVELINLSEIVLSPFYEHQKKGIKFKFDKIIQYGGRESYQISLIDSSGFYTDLLIDKSNLHLLKSESNKEYTSGMIPSTLVFDKYTELNGIKIPMDIEQTLLSQTRTIKIDSVMFNIGLQAFDFKKPK